MGVPHYHQRDSTQWLEWCKQNQAGYGSENSNPFEETESKKREKRTDPRKRRQKKETVSIVGTWTLFAPSKYCVDSVTFNPDHTFTIISGQEIQKGVYAYQKPVKTGKRHKLKTHFKYDNGLPDCSGREYKFTNQKLTHYLEFEYGGTAFTLFTKPSGSEFLVGLWKKVE
jgi:hypothetical protein